MKMREGGWVGLLCVTLGKKIGKFSGKLTGKFSGKLTGQF
jgi:hypothetical protein